MPFLFFILFHVNQTVLAIVCNVHNGGSVNTQFWWWLCLSEKKHVKNVVIESILCPKKLIHSLVHIDFRCADCVKRFEKINCYREMCHVTVSMSCICTIGEEAK